MDALDDWDIVALIFFASVLTGIAVFALVVWVDRHNPFRDTLRNVDGRKRMATEWTRPGYLPESWR